jgi:hypothetical protein
MEHPPTEYLVNDPKIAGAKIIMIKPRDLSGTRPWAAAAIMLMYFRVFDFLRIFEITAPITFMIISIVRDNVAFMAIFSMSIMVFAFSFYLIQLNTIKKSIFGDYRNNFTYSIMYSYMSGMGNYMLDNFGENDSQWILWLIFLACTIFI